MAGEAFSVAWAGQDHRSRLPWHMTATAVQPQLAHMTTVQAVVGWTGAGLLSANTAEGQRHRGSSQQHPRGEAGPALFPGDECKHSQMNPAHFA